MSYISQGFAHRDTLYLRKRVTHLIIQSFIHSYINLRILRYMRRLRDRALSGLIYHIKWVEVGDSGIRIEGYNKPVRQEKGLRYTHYSLKKGCS